MKKISVVLLVFLIGMVFTLCSRTSISSDDGLTWTKYSGNPLDLGDSGNVGDPWVIYNGQMFRMWYTAETDPGVHHICFADSPNGINWTLHGIVLDKGETGSWDDLFVLMPMVLFNGTTYKMWYVGAGSSTTPDYTMIGYATSSNGINWTKYGANPVLIPGGNGGWDDWSIASPPKVIFNGTHYIMWYSAQAFRDSQRRTGAATSTDGTNWTKHPNNPVLVPGPSGWDSRNVWPGPVIMNENCYRMWYTGETLGSGMRIGVATSPDGFSWSKYEMNPVLDRGLSGGWDSDWVWSSCIVEKDNILLMWYTGHALGGHGRIGLADSAITITIVLATIDIHPDTLNLKSKGEWITCYIELSEGYDVSDINVTAVMLNDTIPAELHPVGIGDEDGDGIPDLMVKFDRSDVISYILANVNMTKLFEERFMTVTLTVTGYLNDDTPFQGSDTIKILYTPRGVSKARYIFGI